MISEYIYQYQSWDLYPLLEFLGIEFPLEQFYKFNLNSNNITNYNNDSTLNEGNKNKIEWNNETITHHHPYNTMRQEQSYNRKIFNNYESSINNQILDPVKLYYQNLLYKKKLPILQTNPIQKLISKVNNLINNYQ